MRAEPEWAKVLPDERRGLIVTLVAEELHEITGRVLGLPLGSSLEAVEVLAVPMHLYRATMLGGAMQPGAIDHSVSDSLSGQCDNTGTFRIAGCVVGLEYAVFAATTGWASDPMNGDCATYVGGEPIELPLFRLFAAKLTPVGADGSPWIFEQAGECEFVLSGALGHGVHGFNPLANPLLSDCELGRAARTLPLCSRILCLGMASSERAGLEISVRTQGHRVRHTTSEFVLPAVGSDPLTEIGLSVERVASGQASLEIHFQLPEGLALVCGEGPVLTLRISIEPLDGSATFTLERKLDLTDLEGGFQTAGFPTGHGTLALRTLDRMALPLANSESSLELQVGSNRAELSLVELSNLAITVTDQDGWPVDMPLRFDLERGTTIRQVSIGGRTMTVREGEPLGSRSVGKPPYGLPLLPPGKYTILLGEAGLRNHLVIEPMMAEVELIPGQTTSCEFVALRAARPKPSPELMEEFRTLLKLPGDQ